MEFNRNQFFMIGVFLMLLGIQFRMVDSVTLTDKTTQFLATRTQSASAGSLASMLPTSAMPRKVVHPPQWLGWSLLSIGAVCVLHSLAMKKPGA